MALTLELYRSKLPEPEGKWYVVLARNKKGAVHTQRDVTDLFEQRFRDELQAKIQDHDLRWSQKVAELLQDNANLGNRLRRAETDLNAKQQAHNAQIDELEEVYETSRAQQRSKFENDLQQEANKWSVMVEDLRTQIRDMILAHKREIDIQKRSQEECLQIVQQAFDIATEDGAQVVHRAWSEERMRQGYHRRSMKPWWHVWCFRCHKCLVPYSQLDEQRKEIDRHVFRCVRGEIKRLLGKLIK